MPSLATDGLRFTVDEAEDRLVSRIEDPQTGFRWADGALVTSVVVEEPGRSVRYDRLTDRSLTATEAEITVRGRLGPLWLTLFFRAAGGRIAESVRLENSSTEALSITHFRVGHRRHLANGIGHVAPELQGDCLAAVPFRHHPTVSGPAEYAFRFADLLERRGVALYHSHRFAGIPADAFASEGWVWIRPLPAGPRALGIWTYSDGPMLFSLIGPAAGADATDLVWGGLGGFRTEPDALSRLAAGASLELGQAYYQGVAGDYHEAAYAFRGLLDELGNRFPADFDPPVHWNELYDNPLWEAAPGKAGQGRALDARAAVYTLADMEVEAAKAVRYHCQALYLDPGWDRYTGDFLWAEERLGPLQAFCRRMRERYGLVVSLHTPLAPWANGNRACVATYAHLDGTAGDPGDTRLCLASPRYIQQAAERLKALVGAGVVYVMFDGTAYAGPACANPDHGHHLPLTREDNCRACVELARLLHAAYPGVLIEMHDMVLGGVSGRYTPVYYKYTEPGSYDENWACEFMWRPLEDLVSHRARSLYYYNLACNVPLYVHIDLRDDNAHCVMLWWYASTCRHLGIGGTHRNPATAEAQVQAMRTYRRLKPYFTRGDFYGVPGCAEQMHVHALPERHSAVINVFNLSDEPRVVEGEVDLGQIGLPPDEWYAHPAPHARIDSGRGRLTISRRLPAWGHELIELRSLTEHRRLREAGEADGPSPAPAAAEGR